MARISVIVPVYGVEQYLGRCVDSILAQTFTDFELILVDDGSPDNCGNLCDEYPAKDNRVRVFHQKNQGQAAARNHGVSIARGEWVCFVDSDDLIHPQMLELLYRAATENSVGISMCSAFEGSNIPEEFFEKRTYQCTQIPVTECSLERLYDQGGHRCWVVWAKLLRREIVQRISFTEGRIYEDNAIVCKWLCESTALADVDAPMYFYFVNSDGTTKSSFSKKKVDYLWALEEIIHFYRHKDFRSLLQHFCSTYMITSANYRDMVLSKLHDKALAREISKRMRIIYRNNKQYVELTDGQTDYINSNMFPLKTSIKRYIKMLVEGDYYLIIEKIRNRLGRKGST